MILSAIVAKKLLADEETTACIKQVCLLGVVCTVSNRQTLSFETFWFLEKPLLSIFKFCAWGKLLFFLKLSQSQFPVSAAHNKYELLTGPQFLGRYCYLLAIRLVNFVLVAPVTVVALYQAERKGRFGFWIPCCGLQNFSGQKRNHLNLDIHVSCCFCLNDS